MAIKQGDGAEIESDATSAVTAGELTLDGSASYDGAVINGATPDINKLTAAFKNNSGQMVEVDLAFANPDTALTVTGNVNFTATAKTADSYAVYNGTVNITVKEATPTADDVKLITEDLDQVAVGKTAFASAYANMQYSVDGEHWTDISTTPFDVPESKKIYVHKTGTAYTVKVVANPTDTTKNEASAAGAGDAATNQCIVTVNLEGGAGVDSQRVDYNGTISGTPTKTGYTFAGWFDAATDGNAVTTITENTTVYAQWTEE